ncbi:MAG: hypothetical protein IKZ08_02440 [Bacteroidales bacterium]|nr:hypothetical protein [Bacteroidales bacterium]
MNKLQKEKSLRIKLVMRLSKWPMTYKEAKRLIRRQDRKTRQAAEFYMKHHKETE